MIAFIVSAALFAETQTFADPFDPYVAVLTDLPSASLKQEGGRGVVPFSFVSTFRVRKTGEIQQYLKVELEYASTGLEPPLNVSTAT